MDGWDDGMTIVAHVANVAILTHVAEAAHLMYTALAMW